MKHVCFVCLCVFIGGITPINTEKSHVMYNSIEEKNLKNEVDNFIQHLKNEEWREDETPCLKETLNVLNNVKNFTLWAVWIWDSIQQPVGVFYGSKNQLGNYDQCLNLRGRFRSRNTEVRTQYCLANIKLTEGIYQRQADINFHENAEIYLKKPSKYGRDFTSITWGVCVPEECEPAAVSKILRSLLRRSYLSPLTSNITIESCERSEELRSTTGFYLFMILILILISVAILSTLYSQQYVKIQTEVGTLQKIAKSFDLVRNYKKLIEVRQDDIPVIHSIKSLSALVMVHAHLIQITNAFGVINGLGVERVLDTPIGYLVKNICIGIDHFTVISGVLLMKSLMEKQQNLVHFIIKRYIRLIGPAAVMILYFILTSPSMGSGPLWSRLNGREHDACVRNWWLIPLMLNNYVNTKEMCQVVFWYIPNDFHLAVFGTIIFFVFKKNKTVGWIVLIPVSIYAIIIPSLTTYWEKLPTIILYDIEKTMDLRKNEYFMRLYIKTHQRVGRYLIGMAMGYYMARRPPNYRIVNTTWSTVLMTLNFLFGLFIWAYGGVRAERDYDVLESAIFVGISNICYTVCICITFFICEYGTVPILNDCLKLPLLRFLSRLSYCIYLVHISIVQRNVFSMRAPGTYDISMIFDGTGVFVLSVIISFVMWLLVEAPLASLSNKLLSSGKLQERDENKRTTENGVLIRNGSIKKTL